MDGSEGLYDETPDWVRELEGHELKPEEYSVIYEAAGQGFLKLNKAFLHYESMGPTDAILLSYLLDYYCFLMNKFGKLSMFFCKVELIEKDLNIGQRTQLRSIKKMEALGIMEVIYKGVPRKRYFTINTQKLSEIRPCSAASMF